MQIQILKPSDDGQCYPDYDEFIKNARDEEEKAYLEEVKQRHLEREAEGYKNNGFAFEIIYVTKQACGHYELFQHPLWRNYGKEPTEETTIKSLESVLSIIKDDKRRQRKCTRCICNV